MHIEIKKDSELTSDDTKQLVALYNLSFYNNRVRNEKQLDFMAECLSSLDAFTWYLLKDSDGLLVGMVSLVRDYKNAHLLDVNVELGENICSLAVHPNLRGHGYARDLMDKLMETAYEQGLRKHDPLVLEIKQNSPHYYQLNKLYGSLGFKIKEQTAGGIFLHKSR